MHWVHLPGSESGTAVADVLYGHYSPPGRLVYTIARLRNDLLVDVLHNSDALQPQTNFTEGFLIDCCHCDAHAIERRFRFGFGLSYMRLYYVALQVEFIATMGTTGTVNRATIQRQKASHRGS